MEGERVTSTEPTIECPLIPFDRKGSRVGGQMIVACPACDGIAASSGAPMHHNRIRVSDVVRAFNALRYLDEVSMVAADRGARHDR